MNFQNAAHTLFGSSSKILSNKKYLGIIYVESKTNAYFPNVVYVKHKNKIVLMHANATLVGARK
jgi:hypothetical protein